MMMTPPDSRLAWRIRLSTNPQRYPGFLRKRINAAKPLEFFFWLGVGDQCPSRGRKICCFQLFLSCRTMPCHRRKQCMLPSQPALSVPSFCFALKSGEAESLQQSSSSEYFFLLSALMPPKPATNAIFRSLRRPKPALWALSAPKPPTV